MNEHENNSHITIIDSPPGSGKTSWSIDYINSLPCDEKIIYITPFLSEVARIVRSCSKKNFIQPDSRKGLGRKRIHFLNLVRNGENIVSTHSLFSNIDDEIINAIKAESYTLILDECFDVVEKYNIYQDMPKYNKNTDIDKLTKQDITSLIAKEYIIVEDDYRIIWKDDEHILHKYDPLKRLADRGLLYLVNNSLLLWSFPVEVFRKGIFENIFILTFQFKYQIQYYYYSYFDLEFSTYHIETINNEYTMIRTDNYDYEKEWIDGIRPLINICDVNKINRIGSIYFDAHGKSVNTSLSKNWYRRNSGLYKKIKNNAINFLRNYSDKKSNRDIMWTCFTDYQRYLKDRNLPVKHFVPLNSRATNNYGHKKSLVYLVNRYVNPFFIQFFLKRDIKIDERGFAVSEMLQWILRSRVRNGESVNLYCPSERMRKLLKEYLNKGFL